MYLDIPMQTINEVMQPLKVTTSDIMEINPCFKAGAFQGVVIRLFQNKTIVIANNMVLAYNKIEDFLAGLDPIAMVQNEAIIFDPILESPNININITQDIECSTIASKLMFGARIETDEPTQ